MKCKILMCIIKVSGGTSQPNSENLIKWFLLLERKKNQKKFILHHTEEKQLVMNAEDIFSTAGFEIEGEKLSQNHPWAHF